MTSSRIEPYAAQNHAAGTWGFVGRCAYCVKHATYQRRTQRKRRVSYTALCAKHANMDKEKP